MVAHAACPTLERRVSASLELDSRSMTPSVTTSNRHRDSPRSHRLPFGGLTPFVAAALALAGLGSTGATAFASADLVSVIIRAPGSTVAAERAVADAGGRVSRHLDIIDGFTAVLPAREVPRLASIAGITITRDSTLTPMDVDEHGDVAAVPSSLGSVARQIGARLYWANGFTGKGVDVALIDTGVSPVPGIRAPQKVVNGPDLSFESQDPGLRYLDTYGHGTHMAGIIAGDDGPTGWVSWDHERFDGIAPDARIVSVKVANALGATDVSQVIAAIDWVVEHRTDNDLNIRIINLSFGTDGVQSYLLDPLAYAVEQAWNAGIVVVVAAGNAGFGSSRLNNPAYDPFVIAVGADNTRGTTRLSDDVIPGFSSTGDGSRNPDLVAPGVSVVSLRVPGSELDQTNPAGRLNHRFFKGSGTSQAAAIVSGAAALVIQQRPDITPDQLKHLLLSTASPLPNADDAAQGHGLIHLSAAFSAAADESYTQPWVPSNGSGSLEAARGSLHVADSSGTELRGDVDIFGSTFDSQPRAEQSASGTSWDGGYWNGNEWTGNSWSGDSWTAIDWSGNSWSGNSWSGNSWSGNSWSGNSWSGDSWSGNSWSGNSWSADGWSGNGWLGVSWGKKVRGGPKR